MPELTADERRWLLKAQKVMDECPPRFGFFATGDPDLGIYDRTKEAEIDAASDPIKNTEFSTAVDQEDALLGHLVFTANVCATAG